MFRGLIVTRSVEEVLEEVVETIGLGAKADDVPTKTAQATRAKVVIKLKGLMMAIRL